MNKAMKNLTEAIEFIRNSSEYRTIFAHYSLWRKVLWRKAAFFAWMNGFINFGELLVYFLPYRFRVFGEAKRERDNGTALYLDWKLGLCMVHSDLGIYPVDLPHGPSELMRLIEEIIIKDQYHAKEFIKKDAIIIDAGANIGVFSLFASELAPGGKIFAFEPASETYKVLLKNIKDYRNIIPVQFALGNRSGKSQIFIDSNLSGTNTLIDSEKGPLVRQKGIEEINLMTIDEFVNKNKLSRIDFIKIDTEGYEKQIIGGAIETIKKFNPTIAVSAYHLKSDKELIPALIKSINPQYHYKLLQRDEEDFIFWV
jgi:FkbM family methyltransferase